MEVIRTEHGTGKGLPLPAPPPPGARCTPRNGFYVTDVVYNTRSSIRRVSEHHMLPAEVCDGQDSVRST